MAPPKLPDIPSALDPFEHDLNIHRLTELSAAESRQLLEQAQRAAQRDLEADARREGREVRDAARQQIDAAAERARAGVGESSAENERLICRFWDEVFPLLGGALELPSDRVLMEVVVRAPALRFHAAPEAGALHPTARVIRNRVLQVTGVHEHPGEGTCYYRVINPLDILHEAWVDVGAEQRLVERIPAFEEVLGWGPAAQATHVASTRQFSVEAHDPAIFQRTIRHRLVDHERLLHALRTAEPGTREHGLASRLFDGAPSGGRPVFIDIGPGIANRDLDKPHDGLGTPAITSIEMADAFPDMDVVILDVPEAVQRFASDPLYERGRAELLGRGNVSIVSGSGLRSLRGQLAAPETNPVADRARPAIAPGTPIILRSANALDVYCHWDQPNGDDPSVRDALDRVATEYRENPILLLYNRAILLKQRGETSWRMVGRVSAFGFNSADRRLGHSGRPAYELDAALGA